MMAIAIAMEMFFSTWGAWAKAGAAASMGTEARTASLTKRILELPLSLGVLLNPRQRRLIRPCRRISTDQVVAAEMLQPLAVAGQVLLQPVKLGAEVALHIRGPHADNTVAALLQPGLSSSAVGDNSLRLVRIDQFDGKAVHEGDEIWNLAANGSLPLELAGKAAVFRERLPQDALGVGRVSPQEPRKPL